MEKVKELLEKYGVETSLVIVTEIINEYENNICYRGYDYDHDMWNAQKEDWVKIKTELETLK